MVQKINREFLIDLDILARLKPTAGKVNIDKFVKDTEADIRKSASKLGIKVPATLIPKSRVDTLRKIQDAFGGSSKDIREAAVNVKNLSLAQQAATNTAQALGKKTAETTARFGAYLLASRTILGVSSSLLGAVKNAINFNRELVRVAQLTSTSIAQVQGLGREIDALSSKFGSSANELLQAAQTATQAGKSLNETRALLEAIAPTALGATFSNLNKTTESSIALLGQFNLQATQTRDVLDILNSVSKEFNVSVDELFTGLKRSGAAFGALAGVNERGLGDSRNLENFREFVSLFTAIISTSRESASVVGTSLRTILPRLQRTETIDKLRELGVVLAPLNEFGRQQFIGPFQAIEAISGRLRDLQFTGQTVEFSQIVEQIGGLRQFSRVIPLITQFTRAEEARRVALQASGSVQKDAEIALQDFAVQLQRVQERLQVLAREFVRSGTFERLANAFISSSEAAIRLADALSPLIPLITALAAFRVGKFALNFGKGFRSGTQNLAFNQGGQVPSMLTPGELVFPPQTVKKVGLKNLERFNRTGDASGITSFRGVNVVPGTGSRDTVPADLPGGSFVIRKDSAQRLGGGFFNRGGRVGLQTGAFLDPSFKDAQQVFAREITDLGGSFEDIKNSFDRLADSGISGLDSSIDFLRREVETFRNTAGGSVPSGRRNVNPADLRGLPREDIDDLVTTIDEGIARRTASADLPAVRKAVEADDTFRKQKVRRDRASAELEVIDLDRDIRESKTRTDLQSKLDAAYNSAGEVFEDLEVQKRIGTPIGGIDQFEADLESIAGNQETSLRKGRSAGLAARVARDQRAAELAKSFPERTPNRLRRNLSFRNTTGTIVSGVGRGANLIGSGFTNVGKGLNKLPPGALQGAGIAGLLGANALSQSETRFGQAASGLLGGGVTGGAALSGFGPVGTAIGAIGGAAIGATLALDNFAKETEQAALDLNDAKVRETKSIRELLQILDNSDNAVGTREGIGGRIARFAPGLLPFSSAQRRVIGESPIEGFEAVAGDLADRIGGTFDKAINGDLLGALRQGNVISTIGGLSSGTRVQQLEEDQQKKDVEQFRGATQVRFDQAESLIKEAFKRAGEGIAQGDDPRTLAATTENLRTQLLGNRQAVESFASRAGGFETRFLEDEAFDPQLIRLFNLEFNKMAGALERTTQRTVKYQALLNDVAQSNEELGRALLGSSRRISDADFSLQTINSTFKALSSNEIAVKPIQNIFDNLSNVSSGRLENTIGQLRRGAPGLVDSRGADTVRAVRLLQNEFASNLITSGGSPQQTIGQAVSQALGGFSSVVRDAIVSGLKNPEDSTQKLVNEGNVTSTITDLLSNQNIQQALKNQAQITDVVNKRLQEQASRYNELNNLLLDNEKAEIAASDTRFSRQTTLNRFFNRGPREGSQGSIDQVITRAQNRTQFLTGFDARNQDPSNIAQRIVDLQRQASQTADPRAQGQLNLEVQRLREALRLNTDQTQVLTRIQERIAAIEEARTGARTLQERLATGGARELRSFQRNLNVGQQFIQGGAIPPRLVQGAVEALRLAANSLTPEQQRAEFGVDNLENAIQSAFTRSLSNFIGPDNVGGRILQQAGQNAQEGPANLLERAAVIQRDQTQQLQELSQQALRIADAFREARIEFGPIQANIKLLNSNQFGQDLGDIITAKVSAAVQQIVGNQAPQLPGAAGGPN